MKFPVSFNVSGIFPICLTALALTACQQPAPANNAPQESAPTNSALTVADAQNTANQAEEAAPLALFPEFTGAEENECCKQSGQIEECFAQDVLGDGGRITCNSSLDCAAGQVCNTSFGGRGFKGRCTCDSNSDCRGDDGEGLGVCHPNQSICGPSFCSGYYICSCWGGCDWWSAESPTYTPQAHANAMGLFCCEKDYPVDGTYGYITNLECADYIMEGYCSSDAECNDNNDCTIDECKGTGVFKVCFNTPDTGAICEADDNTCTIDTCLSDGTCSTVSPACPVDTYVQPDGTVAPNTCTTDCVEDRADLDGNGIFYDCHVPLSQPSDSDVKPSDPSCNYWTCSSSDPTIPVYVGTDCTSLNDTCNTYSCDPLGAKNNCQNTAMHTGATCTSSNPANKCIAASCADPNGDGVATCEDYSVPPPFVETDVCNNLQCTPVDGSWSLVPDPTALGESCDDAMPCTLSDVCTVTGSCEGTFNICATENSGDDCRQYACNATSGACEVTSIYNGNICSDGDGLFCTNGACDAAGACQPVGVSCGGVAPECNTYVCAEEITDCAYVAETSQTCENTVAANCISVCQSVAHSNPLLNLAGYEEGYCGNAGALNDSCDNAISIHAFTAGDSGVYGVSGSTQCASDQHASSNNTCLLAGTAMGRGGKDAVYSFTYTPSEDCSYKCGSDADCDDGSTCTNDSCDTASGECVNTSNGTCANLFFVPGRIQAEAFHRAYEKGAGNSGAGSGCTSTVNIDVDMKKTADADGAANCKVVDTATGEWLEYDFLVSQVGEYTATFRVANYWSSRTTTISVDGVDVGTYTSSTGGSESFEDREIVLGTLGVGQHILRVYFNSYDNNLNYIDIARTSTGGTLCPNKYIVKVESAFDAVVYVSKDTCGGAFVNSRDCSTTQDNTLAEDTCASPFNCSAVSGSFGQQMATTEVPEEPSDNATQTVYVFVDSQSASAEGLYYVSVEKQVGCPHPSTWYDGVIHNRLELGANNETTRTVQATVRDFSEDHPDFERTYANGATTGLVQDTIGPDRKPVFKSTGCASTYGVCMITSTDTFDDWYNTIEGTNYEKLMEFELTPNTGNPNVYEYDNDRFFPLSLSDGFGGEGQKDDDGKKQNFHFTTEIHTEFTYEPGQSFSFRGDDDLWVFVNDKLVMDIGGIHGPISGTINMDTLGLVHGSTYKMDIFHAERHETGSNFRITTNIASLLTELVQIPINGVDFPDIDPNTQISNDGTIVANAVVLSGDTRTTTNAYTGEDGDSTLLFAGNDELWELGPVTDGARVNISLCDFGGDVDISSGDNPSIALFNCHGERVALNDDGSSCGDARSAIEPSPTLSSDVGPYYLLIDQSGSSGGFKYDASLYYDPRVTPPIPDTDSDTDTDTDTGTPPILSCDPDASVFNFWTDIEQGNPNMGDLRFYPDGCVLVTDDDRNWFEAGDPPHNGGPYRGIRLNTSGVNPGNRRCFDSGIPGNIAHCFPFRFYYDLLYTDSSGTSECRLQGYVECFDGHFNTCTGGYYGDGVIPTPQACPNDPTHDVFVNMMIGWTYPTNLTPAETAECQAECTSTNTFFLRTP
ncbi:MAG: fibro-slime domain-containing protein [Deltaproteobacteria bacterium]|nr:fibro-slime domain-containing protein [Deltaproteobacteria bacterium]